MQPFRPTNQSLFAQLGTRTMTTLHKVHREQDSKAQRTTLTNSCPRYL